MTLKKMQEYYNSRAPEYEQIYYRDIEERQLELADQRTQVESIVSGKTVIELACGTGYWTKVASETAKSIVALDASAEMIAEAMQKKYKCDVEFICTDMYSSTLKLESTDTVLVGFWFSHQPKQDYKKFFSLLKNLVNKGQIWLIDNNPPAESSVNKTHREDQFHNCYKMRYLDDGKQFEILKNYFSEAELREIISPYFEIKNLIYKHYYWSVVLGKK